MFDWSYGKLLEKYKDSPDKLKLISAFAKKDST
jgi:hypothetical protein